MRTGLGDSAHVSDDSVRGIGDSARWINDYVLGPR